MTRSTLNPSDTMPTFEILMVTPALAAVFLAHMGKNRPLDPAWVRSFATAMSNGEWKITGDAIKFNIHGVLFDGQHRLQAVIVSGETVAMAVVRNLPPEAMNVIDQGRKRSPGDVLLLSDTVDQHQRTIAAAARIAILVAEGGNNLLVRPNTNGARTVRTAELMAYVKSHESLVDAASFAAQVHTRTRWTPPSVMAYVYMRLTAVDHAAGVAFLRDVAEKRTQGQGDPIAAILRAYDARPQLRYTGHLYIYFTAWNAHRKGVNLRGISVAPDRVTGKPKVIPPVHGADD